MPTGGDTINVDTTTVGGTMTIWAVLWYMSATVVIVGCVAGFIDVARTLYRRRG